MKKIMISSSVLGCLITGVAVASWIVACLVARRRYRNYVEPPFCGEITEIQVVRPKYTDPTRNGTRIDFSLRLWGTGQEKTKIKSVYATLVSSVKTGMNMFVRPLLRQNPIRYNYVFHSGVDVTFDVCAYLDDIKPEDVDADLLLVEVRDMDNKQYLFTKKPGVKAVFAK